MALPLGLRGFTLIELLVVIAIIGLLSSVILASLGGARAKGRDARRIADIRQLQMALELYYDTNNKYPQHITSALLVTPGYIASIPKDPANTAVSYLYVALGGSTCTTYHLGAQLETRHSALSSDSDATAATPCTLSPQAADFNGLATNGASGTVCNGTAGTNGSSGTETCYDVKP